LFCCFVVLRSKTKGFKQKDSNNKQQNNNLDKKRWLLFEVRATTTGLGIPCVPSKIVFETKKA